MNNPGHHHAVIWFTGFSYRVEVSDGRTAGFPCGADCGKAHQNALDWAEQFAATIEELEPRDAQPSRATIQSMTGRRGNP